MAAEDKRFDFLYALEVRGEEVQVHLQQDVLHGEIGRYRGLSLSAKMRHANGGSLTTCITAGSAAFAELDDGPSNSFRFIFDGVIQPSESLSSSASGSADEGFMSKASTAASSSGGS